MFLLLMKFMMHLRWHASKRLKNPARFLKPKDAKDHHLDIVRLAGDLHWMQVETAVYGRARPRTSGLARARAFARPERNKLLDHKTRTMVQSK